MFGILLHANTQAMQKFMHIIHGRAQGCCYSEILASKVITVAAIPLEAVPCHSVSFAAGNDTRARDALAEQLRAQKRD